MTTTEPRAGLQRGTTRDVLEVGSPVAVYRTGRGAAPRTLWDIVESTAARYPRAAAIDDGDTTRDYGTLLGDVQRLRDRLWATGIGRGDRVGIRVPSGTAELYVAILAVLAVGAAYVPVDAEDPSERAELVWSEAAVCAVIGAGGELSRTAVAPEGAAGRPEPDDDAWIIFTSGSTGTPKGVAVTHRSAAAFVDAEADLFLRDSPLGPDDRVLAGLSVAFDASCEEMWLAWRHGACLVPAPRSLMKTGPELGPWLVRRRISVVSTVPTMASLWSTEALGGVRLLILGGEACPAALADRLAQRCPEVWNTYGPTEATVVACAARLLPGEPVRIGLPLPGWQLAVIDPHSGEPVGWGETGELVIGGIGVARYLDPEKDAARFAPVQALGVDRAYRSGDLVEAAPEGLIYLGRTDTQVKIRGYRIELTEIESVLMRLPRVAQAVVTTYEPRPGLVELVAYYSARDADCPPAPLELYDHLRSRLPVHMVPSHLEPLPEIPLLPSGKADRKRLPRPTGLRRAVERRPFTPPSHGTEQVLAAALAEVLGLDRVSVDSHFFDDLGANSLLIAHFCARIREQEGAPPVSTKDVYLHPTVRGLAAAVPALPAPDPVARADEPGLHEPAATRTLRYALCGVAQLLVLLAEMCGVAALAATGLAWIGQGTAPVDLYGRAVVFGAGSLVLLCALPILAKWTLIGRWTPQDIPVWTLRYFRFWLVKTLIRGNPLALFSGSPLYVLYLRALGARIGRHVVILSKTVPVCTDLLTIGDNSVIQRDASFTGYRATAGVIRTGFVSIGSNAFVGERTVIDIDATLGHGAQLGHASCLYRSQTVPDGEHWHGSPAQPTQVDYCRVGAAACGSWRRAGHASLQLLVLVFVTTPAAFVIGSAAVSQLSISGVARGVGLTTWSLYRDALAVSSLLFFGGVVAGGVAVTTVPRLLRRFLRPGRTYPLYGVHHLLHRIIRRLSNAAFYQQLFGDSSYMVLYLRSLGYRFPSLLQTGSNAGASIGHENPFLVEVGRGTQMSDGVRFVNADYSNTSFRSTAVDVGAGSFLGNSLAYPSGARVGNNCLIATKAMVPLDGPLREGVGLLGSPCFEIPRSVQRDRIPTAPTSRRQFRRQLAAKNRYNLITMGIFLAVRWFHAFVLTLLGLAAWSLGAGNGVVALVGWIVVSLLFSVTYFAAVERGVVTLRPLRPQFRSIYEPYFWWHERYWKLQMPHHLSAFFNGTPFKSLIWRLLGARIGHRLFDDGLQLQEPPLVTIGRDCTVNDGTVIQCHSMEDGTFKSDYTVLEDGCTLGIGAFVHYGVTMRQGASLQPDSFLMKGEQAGVHTQWGGNPARQT